MFKLFSRRKNGQRAREAAAYVAQTYIAPPVKAQVCYSLNLNPGAKPSRPRKDSYDAANVVRILRGCEEAVKPEEVLNALQSGMNRSFVYRLLEYISCSGLQATQVYKAAQIDKRLFSKMMSDREYRPSKDTAVALLLALHLNIDEANDMLSRAGYTLSHSNKRDIILEFCFREEIFNLMDVNDILYRLKQKPLGRA